MRSRIRTLIGLVVLLGGGMLFGSGLGRQAGDRGFKAPIEAAPPLGRRIRVEVLNAGGRPNVARVATEALRSAGFDVVNFGNAPEFGAASSEVIDRVDEVELAHAVAGTLGIERVKSEPDSTLFVDVTVRIGTDWNPPEEAAVDGGSGEVGFWGRLKFWD